MRFSFCSSTEAAKAVGKHVYGTVNLIHLFAAEVCPGVAVCSTCDWQRIQRQRTDMLDPASAGNLT